MINERSHGGTASKFHKFKNHFSNNKYLMKAYKYKFTNNFWDTTSLDTFDYDNTYVKEKIRI